MVSADMESHLLYDSVWGIVFQPLRLSMVIVFNYLVRDSCQRFLYWSGYNVTPLTSAHNCPQLVLSFCLSTYMIALSDGNSAPHRPESVYL